MRALYIERYLQATHQDESDPQDQQMESDGSDEQDTPVKTLSVPENQPQDLDIEVQPQEVDNKELQPKHKDEKPEQQDGSEQQQALVVESEQVTGERGNDQQLSNEKGVAVGEVKPRPLMEMKPTSDYYSASDVTKEEEAEAELSMAVEINADLNQNVDSSVNADASKEVRLCTYYLLDNPVWGCQMGEGPTGKYKVQFNLGKVLNSFCAFFQCGDKRSDLICNVYICTGLMCSVFVTSNPIFACVPFPYLRSTILTLTGKAKEKEEASKETTRPASTAKLHHKD